MLLRLKLQLQRRLNPRSRFAGLAAPEECIVTVVDNVDCMRNDDVCMLQYVYLLEITRTFVRVKVRPDRQ